MNNNPNPETDVKTEDVTNTNPPAPDNGTEPKVDTEIDYAEKFKHSQAEAIRLFQENEDLKRQLEEKSEPPDPANHDINTKPDNADLFPGFELLDEEAKQNLIEYTRAVTGLAREEIFKDPAIAHSRQVYSEKKFNDALSAIVDEFPDLSPHKDEFRSQYYNPLNVPDNISDVLRDLAKVYLFDKAKEIGAAEADERNSRVVLDDVTGGDRTPQTGSRTLEEWNALAKSNPAQFALLSKEFNEDLANGRI